jgi:hypothetical protein
MLGFIISSSMAALPTFFTCFFSLAMFFVIRLCVGLCPSSLIVRVPTPPDAGEPEDMFVTLPLLPFAVSSSECFLEKCSIRAALSVRRPFSAAPWSERGLSSNAGLPGGGEGLDADDFCPPGDIDAFRPTEALGFWVREARRVTEERRLCCW